MDAEDVKLPPMLSDERAMSILCHLSTLVPIWALASNALIYFTYRESSRAICFHARQGIHFHLLLLIVSVPMSLLLRWWQTGRARVFTWPNLKVKESQ